MLLLLLSFIILPAGVFAGFRPSFRLDYCAWEATHIIVVTEGDVIDGNLLVLESIKGDLRGGETIPISEFADFRKPQLRQARTEIVFVGSDFEKYQLGPGKQASGIPFNPNANRLEAGLTKSITCSRFILFLIQVASGTKTKWKPAAPFGGFFVSAVWLESHGTYAFHQVISDNPSELLPISAGEIWIRDQIAEIVKAKDSLPEVLAISEKGKRAEALEPFLRSTSSKVLRLGFEEIRKCEKPALPVLRRLINDDSMLVNSRYLFATFADIDAAQAGPELTSVLREELQFWKEMAPKLNLGWWHQTDQVETVNLRNRFERIYNLLEVLGKLRFAGSREVVTQLRDLWRSQVVLGDSRELRQINKECDNLLAELQNQ